MVIKMPNDIPVLKYTTNPESDPLWTMLFGSVIHPDFQNPVFLRHNNQSLNIFNLFNNETVYLIGRGPSLGKVLENKDLKTLLYNPTIVKYGMNSSPDVMDFNVNLWSAVDRMTKFSSRILKNPNIMKFIPMNRFQVNNFDMRQNDCERTVGYKINNKLVHSCMCPNTIGVQTFLVETHEKLSFGNIFLGTTAVPYGFYNGQKSVLLFSIKVCLLLGFKKIVLIGVDFNMDNETPYYKMTKNNVNKFHITHNNKLYKSIAPKIKDICNLLHNNKSIYKSQIVTSNPIESMPFIPVISLKESLGDDIIRKEKGD